VAEVPVLLAVLMRVPEQAEQVVTGYKLLGELQSAKMLTVFIGLAVVAEELAPVVLELAARVAEELGQVVTMGQVVLLIPVAVVERTGVIPPVILAEVAAVD
jgi:hypothetical protein